MDLVLLKSLLLGVMFAVAIVFGWLPIKVYKWILSTGRSHDSKDSLAISLLTCFAGGVFLAVCILDMLPDAMENYEDLQKVSGFRSSYPFVTLLAGCGFFLVSFIEVVTGLCCKDSLDHESECSTPVTRKHAPSFERPDSEEGIIPCGDEEPAEDNLVKSLTFILAFIMHTSLEGFAFGVQEDTISVASLFFGIIVHKAVVSFSIGMRLVRSHPARPYLVAAMTVFIALTAPAGGAIGILVQDSEMNAIRKGVVTGVLMSLSLGTFLYITFFEILAPEQSNRHSKLLQWLATAAGFTIIAVMMIFG